VKTLELSKPKVEKKVQSSESKEHIKSTAALSSLNFLHSRAFKN
jgi:hypothetical protein